AIKADMLDSKMTSKVALILSELNFKPSIIMKKYGVSACTDVTGFGLAGHAYEMSNEDVTIKFDFDSIPVLEEAFDLADMGIIPAGTYNNMSYLKDKVKTKKEYQNEIFFYDAQTSGGLLICVSEKDAKALLHELREEGCEYANIIARICEKEESSLVI
ncbi:MAG: AIR synthase-related protein, partial [Campylobacteraceae bacterium]|nr:AIR synthase-related protein [Campylobacteraceae bacterium]